MLPASAHAEYLSKKRFILSLEGLSSTLSGERVGCPTENRK
jgi:hypothetical protein